MVNFSFNQVFFYSAGDINHTGIVVSVEGGSVHTVEGNSTDKVAERVYSVNDSKIAGYGRPLWVTVEGEDISAPAEDGKKADEQRTYTLTMPYLQVGSFGDAVWTVQTLLQAHNISCGSYGADRDFGADTEQAVREFQRKHGLRADGVVGPETGAALFGGKVNTEEVKDEPKEVCFFGIKPLIKGEEKIRRVLRESCPFLNLKSSRTSNASFTVSNMGV